MYTEMLHVCGFATFDVCGITSTYVECIRRVYLHVHEYVHECMCMCMSMCMSVCAYCSCIIIQPLNCVHDISTPISEHVYVTVA